MKIKCMDSKQNENDEQKRAITDIDIAQAYRLFKYHHRIPIINMEYWEGRKILFWNGSFCTVNGKIKSKIVNLPSCYNILHFKNIADHKDNPWLDLRKHICF